MVTISFGKSPNLMERDDEHISLDVFPRKMDSWKMKPFRIPIDGSIKGLVCLPTFAPTDPLMGFYSMVPFQDRPIDAEKLQQKKTSQRTTTTKKTDANFFVGQQNKPIISRDFTATTNHHHYVCCFARRRFSQGYGHWLECLGEGPWGLRDAFLFFWSQNEKKATTSEKLVFRGGSPPHVFGFFFKQGLNMS